MPLIDQEYDIAIIGGGATGLGTALDAASRGYRVILVEQHDFGKGTSSRSTKLVHGGVRYMQQGNIKLVREALRERAYLLQNAPHLCRVQPFVIPVYSFWQKWFYGFGLALYDFLSAKHSLGKTDFLSRKKTLELLPSLNEKNLVGGVIYFDGQFDDARMCVELAMTAKQQGATLLNYCKAIDFIKRNDKIVGIQLENVFTNEIFQVNASLVINATGVFSDAIMQLDIPTKPAMISPSQGIHLVVDPSFFPGTHAMMIPKTDDGRVLFAVPWKNEIVIGTTDTAVDNIELEPKPLQEEIDFIISHFNRYTTQPISKESVKSVFVGLRPLVKASDRSSTSLLSRDHTIVISPSNLISITGGKWTTYRKMAEDAVNNAIFIAKLPNRKCITQSLPVNQTLFRSQTIEQLIIASPQLAEKLHPSFEYRMADIVFAIDFEMAKTLEDLLARRTRILLLNAQLAIELAPSLAKLMAEQLGKSAEWMEQEIEQFKSLASQYRIDVDELFN